MPDDEKIEPVTDGSFAGYLIPGDDDVPVVSDDAEPLDAGHEDSEHEEETS